ncbi:helix-turn-helix domain-containing protein [Actinotalea sp. C106]|uniref:helix-turn-helix domain-containing protein n=1 Tax=Actinotalea sp. C106 TaxID=2908644 RepID=UPI002541724C|nr:helix-turn-helix transcriptional regulator [Actinotalea sp. C106]
MDATVTDLHPRRGERAAWRHAIGRRLREVRLDAGLRLVDVAAAAQVSAQYLSEVERGRKEASSEVLGAVTRALGMTLVDLAGGLARDLARAADAPVLLAA